MRLHSAVLLVVALWTTSQALAQTQTTVKGTVIDNQSGLTIPGVNVFIRGEKKGTVTDTLGRFRIEIPAGMDVVVIFSHIAYQKVARSVRFDEQPVVQYRIALEPDTLKLQEYVIWGIKPINISESAKRRALFTLSEGEFEHLGEPDMDKALQYLLPHQVKPLSARMMKPEDDFTLYVNGDWKESLYLADINPYVVRRVMVWEMLGPERNIDSQGRDAGSGKTIDVFPIQMPLRRGKFVISVETKQ